METNSETQALELLRECGMYIDQECPMGHVAIQLLCHLLSYHCREGQCVGDFQHDTMMKFYWRSWGPRSAHISISMNPTTLKTQLRVRYQHRWRDFSNDEIYAASDYANDVSNDTVAPGY